MGVGRYNVDHDDDEDDDYVSLWSHSPLFRRLVYAAILLFVAVVYGFYVFHQAMMVSKAHHQRIQAVINNANNTNNSGKNNTISPTPTAAAINLQDSLANYPLADDWIASKLNPNRIVPATGFDAYYFNSEDPTYTVIHKENRRDIHIDYSYDEFHQIPSQNFGGYWIGKFTAPQDGSYELTGDASWSESRVLLNGRVIGKGNNGFPSTTLYLRRGEYTLEFEYVNNWHTTNMYAKLQIPVKSYERGGELSSAIANLNLPADTRLYLAAVSGSEAPDKTIKVVSNAPDPYVLMLSSFNRVNWEVYGMPPRAIIYNTGGTVASVGSPPAFRSDVYTDEDLFNSRPQCSCHRGIFNCGTTPDINEVIANVRSWTGLTLVGGTGGGFANTLNLPNTYLDSHFIQTYQNEYSRQRQECAVPHLKQGANTQTP